MRCSISKGRNKRRTSACAARTGRIRAACAADADDGADVDGIGDEEEGEEEGEEDDSDATRAAEDGESRAARI